MTSQYLISVCHDDADDGDFESPDAQRRFEQVDAFNDELRAAGAWVFAGGLHVPETGAGRACSADSVLGRSGDRGE